MTDKKLTRDWGNGDLQHHWMPCDDCDGTGLDEDDNCSTCGGEKQLFWGSFYDQDDSHCDFCKRAGVGVAAMYEGGHPDREWACLRCYLTHHMQSCGCALWKKAEEAFGLERPTCSSSSASEGSMNPSRATSSDKSSLSRRLSKSRTTMRLSSRRSKPQKSTQRAATKSSH